VKLASVKQYVLRLSYASRLIVMLVIVFVALAFVIAWSRLSTASKADTLTIDQTSTDATQGLNAKPLVMPSIPSSNHSAGKSALSESQTTTTVNVNGETSSFNVKGGESTHRQYKINDSDGNTTVDISIRSSSSSSSASSTSVNMNTNSEVDIDTE
jgi:hypothetical protein